MVKSKYFVFIRLFRVEQWFKNLFLLVGVWFALRIASGEHLRMPLFSDVALGLFVASIMSSANYIVNQITDLTFDKKHPLKKKRPLPSGDISAKSAFFIMIMILVVSFTISLWLLPSSFVLMVFVFWVAGLLYNVPPIRLKDVPYIDVLVESVNNPIRFSLGWFLILPNIGPSMLILLLTWTSAAIVLTMKRYFELITYRGQLSLYRSTFKSYTLRSLKLMTVFYILLTGILLFLLVVL